MQFQWDDAFATGIDEIDVQHREFVELVNEYTKELQYGLTIAEISVEIDKLYQYAIRHFKTEESYMDFNEYPLYFEQINAHISYLDQIMQFKKNIIDKNECSFVEFLQFAVTWFERHMFGLDSTLRDNFIKRGLVKDEQ